MTLYGFYDDFIDKQLAFRLIADCKHADKTRVVLANVLSVLQSKLCAASSLNYCSAEL